MLLAVVPYSKEIAMKRLAFSGLVLLASCVWAATAQRVTNEPNGQTAALPTVDEVLDRYVQALGGRAAIERVKSSVAKGTMEIPAAGVTGSIEFWKKAPNLILNVVTVAGTGASRTGFDGSVGWSENPHQGLVTLKGQQLAQLALQADFYSSINLKLLYSKMTLIGMRKDDERDSYVIDATTEGGRSVKFHFDKDTGLLIRTDSGVDGQEISYFGDYREVEGVKAPFLLREVNPAITVIIKLTEIKNNIAIDDSQFRMPQGK
jgi:zinc protease